ncbi:hypothetical protein PHYSODRAFT_479296 [Phytophthora sojae]|uniref:Uncharacterized protein n=1 Tax=Phytophthora sojae (strain P6497) TaxID=1094619 RepID=G4YSJ2_PHYSP|nr:hypothetical protein PHYSODRAFT_479296 [Phytophthora sojae]EGZ23008.1 hypothetical protein PHYSODRAFT_479296 [Phytophthora sojae]|eukprot:XP_009518296.1 hypothetical protein PHYSODRAFT_479296 [Phytophthora sojae]
MASHVQRILSERAAARAASQVQAFNAFCTRLGVDPPRDVPLRQSNGHWQHNTELQRVTTAMACEHKMRLQDIVELVRDQERGDFRPNKTMYPSRFTRLLDGYRHKDLLVQIARTGIQPTWKQQDPSRTKPIKNHRSASRHLNAVIRAIRKGQDAGLYLVLDAEVLRHWENIQISPLGAVPNKDCSPEDEVRLIHDLSFPRGHSTNDASRTEDCPDVEYKHVAAIAKRIEACHARYKGAAIMIMKGDVKGAFRHLMLASGHVRWMAATIPELGVLIVDISAPF